MNLTALQTRCKSRFRDTNNNILADADWTNYLNDAYRDVIAAEPYWPFLDVSTPADLAAGSDAPVFDSKYHAILVEGAMAKAYFDDGANDQYQAHRGEFDRLLQAMTTDLLRGRRRGA